MTGSGKTEVYLQTIAACLERGEQALVLLPEIALTPQTLARFEARFDAPVLALHSGMGDAERDRVWAAARRGTAAIILGTRSAVFAPLQQPGIIIVDEEHDAAFVQQDGFRYSARDVAIKRGQLEHCPVLLGTATPSLESWHNAETGRYQRHRLTSARGAGISALAAANRHQRVGFIRRPVGGAYREGRCHTVRWAPGSGLPESTRLRHRNGVPRLWMDQRLSRL